MLLSYWTRFSTSTLEVAPRGLRSQAIRGETRHEMTPQGPRIVLLTYGTRGDVEPFVALAVALRARGYRIAPLDVSVPP